ncbi:MAG: hypothetical protein CMB53_04025 [Euryarchaeota archaeon]|nr:hypothetical protein [Euryarchaeota archaeon]
MVRSKLQYCEACETYGLGPKCEKCGSSMTPPSPLKYSPEDPQGARRRERQRAGSDGWIDSLPTSGKGESEEED